MTTAERHIAHRTNVKPAIAELKKRPEVIASLIAEFDRVVDSLNIFLDSSCDQAAQQVDLMPNAVHLHNIIGEREHLPRISDSEPHLDEEKTKERCGDTFAWANKYMRRGEQDKTGELGWWKFHEAIKDPAKLAASFMIEAYEVFVEYDCPAPFLKKIVLSFEEMLAVHHSDTSLFQQVKDWYTTEEGFSPELVNMVKERAK